MLGRTFWPEFNRFSLSALCREFEIDLVGAHRATVDARATGLLLSRMVRGIPSRVWPQLASDLRDLISTTTHRSRFFFENLVSSPDLSVAPASIPNEKRETRGGQTFEDLDSTGGKARVTAHPKRTRR